MTPRADLRAHGPAGVLRPGIRTYKPRRTRMTERQEKALAEYGHLVIPVSPARIDAAQVWGHGIPIILDIGFGDGLATAAMAAADPGKGILAIDVHTPGVGELLARLGEAGLTNVRVMEADALGVLSRMIQPASVQGIRTYFPDPWPKARHHKRRIVQPEVLALVRSRMAIGATWHLATDWDEYADAMRSCFDAQPGWEGGVIERPPSRPVTRYERRALRDGRSVTDLRYRAVDAA